MKSFYGQVLPGIDPATLNGTLIVLEGADGSGRSTQTALIKDWLEGKGHAVVDVGLRRSSLVSKQLDEAKQGNVLGPTTFSLFYATDFADQLENAIIPALRSGFVVLADRYIYTLIARDVVRGEDRSWLESLYSIGIVPDIVFYLKASPQQLVVRSLLKNTTLDYWEAGMDLGLSRDLHQSFIKYQRLIQREFDRMQDVYGFEVINGNRTPRNVFRDIRARLEYLLAGRKA